MSTGYWVPVAGQPGYTELRVDGRVRGYVERETRLAFWNYTPWGQGRSFCTIARPGTYATVQEAMDALAEHVQRLDVVCDGRRGIQGSHVGCSPERCAPSRQTA